MVRNKQIKKIIILSDQRLDKKQGAAYTRILNYARMLTYKNNCEVLLCSFQLSANLDNSEKISENIYILGNRDNFAVIRRDKFLNFFFNPYYIIQFFRMLRQVIGNDKIIWIIYPSLLLNNIISLFHIKFIRKEKIFCEKNELKTGIVLNYNLPVRLSKRVIYFLFFPFIFMGAWLNDRTVIFYDGLVVISNNIKRWTKKYNKRTIRIPIITDFENFGSLSDTKINKWYKPKFRIGFFGAISNKKEGISDFILSMKLLVDKNLNIELNLFGELDIKNKQQLDKIISTNRLSSVVVYHGNIDHGLSLKNMQEQDLLILTRPLNKQNHYGFSTKLAEYLASGTPVLVTAVSDNSIYIKDNINGFIIEPGNKKLLAEKLMKILSMNSEELKKIGLRGKLLAKQTFDYNNYSELLYNFILGN